MLTFEERIHKVQELFSKGQFKQLRTMVADMHAADISDVIDNLEHNMQYDMIKNTRDIIMSKDITYLEEYIIRILCQITSMHEICAMLVKMPEQDALYIFNALSSTMKNYVLSNLANKQTLQYIKSFYNNEVRRILEKEPIILKETWSIKKALTIIKGVYRGQDYINEVYVVDDEKYVIGKVKLGVLIANMDKENVRVKDVMSNEFLAVRDENDISTIVHTFTKYTPDSICLIDAKNKFLGIITASSMMDVVEDEGSEDFLQLAGIHGYTEGLSIYKLAILRTPWLLMSGVSSLMGATVIKLFSATIEKHIVLAMLLPILACITGNVGIQALTVSINKIISKQILSYKYVYKEVLISIVNGFIISITLCLIMLFLIHDIRFIFIFAISLFIAMICASFIGSIIPITLAKCSIDPTISSSVFITSLIDFISFLILLTITTKLYIV